MKVTSTLIVFLTILSASAMASSAVSYERPRDMNAACGDAVIAKMQSDREISGYLTEEAQVTLEWNEEGQSAVAFNIQFNPADSRDGYMVGEIAVKVAENGTCRVGKILRTSIGD